MKIFNDKFQNVYENLKSLEDKNSKIMSTRSNYIQAVKKLKAKFDSEEILLNQTKTKLEKTEKEHSNKDSELTKLQKDLIECKNSKKSKAGILVRLERDIFKLTDNLSIEKKKCEKIKRKCKLQDQNKKKVRIMRCCTRNRKSKVISTTSKSRS